MPPPKLALRFQWLPPILYKLYQNSISGYSKAPRGLSVLSRVTCIFTGTIISPSLWLRQCPNRYTFRAGRNLPDKEFRYLWHRYSYGRRLLGLQFRASLTLTLSLTFQHRAGVTLYFALRLRWHVVSRGFLVRYRQGAAYSTSTCSSLTTEFYDPKAFITHAALLRQTFVHCGRFPTAASVGVWAVSQSQCGRSASQVGYASLPW